MKQKAAARENPRGDFAKKAAFLWQLLAAGKWNVYNRIL